MNKKIWFFLIFYGIFYFYFYFKKNKQKKNKNFLKKYFTKKILKK